MSKASENLAAAAATSSESDDKCDNPIKTLEMDQIKQEYRDQTDNWNRHLDDSKRKADAKLQKMLAQHSKK